MPRILFILRSISAHDQQNALCVEGIVEYLNKAGLAIDYVSWEDEAVSKQDGIYPVVLNKTGDLTFMNKIYKTIHMPLGRGKLIRKFYNTVEECINTTKYDAIIAVINPPEAVEALYQIKKKYKNIKAVLYEIDPNSNRYKKPNNLFERIWKKRTTKWEQKIYSAMDTVIHMESHRNHFTAGVYKTFENKTVYLDIPNFKPIELPEAAAKKDDTAKLLYTGAFYPKLRDPEYMFSILGEISKRSKIKLDIYTGKSMRERVEQIAESADFIEIHNEIPQDELMQVISDSDVLISIGNKDSDFLPSKTLMYMSVGKPVIHFYSDDEDVSARYFAKYPKILMIDQRKEINDELLKEICNFINGSQYDKEVDYAELSKSLEGNTPEYSAKKIMEIIG